MTKACVLIISQVHEPSTDVVCRHLRGLGVEPIRIDSERFALSTNCSVRLGISGQGFSLTSEQGSVDSDDLLAVWHRRWTYPAYPATFDEATISFCFSELTGLLGGLPHVSGLRWVNHIHAERSASNKILQLSVARELGFPIPETLVSNCAAEVRDFVTAHPAGVVFKPVSGSSILYRSYSADVVEQLEANHPGIGLDKGLPNTGLVLYTQPLTPDKCEKLNQLHWSPAIFQVQIHKTADVRVTVVGDQLFACLIHSQAHPETTVDFRQMNRGYDLAHEAIDLPSHVATFTRRLMRELGLEFACFDFVIDASTGSYVFLEANPAGQWLWVEAKTGLPISKALARHLAGRPPD